MAIGSDPLCMQEPKSPRNLYTVVFTLALPQRTSKDIKSHNGARSPRQGGCHSAIKITMAHPISPENRPQAFKTMGCPFFKVKTTASSRTKAAHPSLDHTETEVRSPRDCNELFPSSTGFCLLSLHDYPISKFMGPAPLPHGLAIDVVYAVYPMSKGRNVCSKP